MSITIQAYFHNENEAEDAKILLQTYDIEILEIGPRTGSYPGEGRLIVPLAEGSNMDGSAGVVNTGASYTDNNSAIVPLVGLESLDDRKNNPGTDSGTDSLHWVLSAKVSNSDYSDVVDLIRRNRGHLEKLN